jgi:GAF domain-containing protein
MEMLEKQVNELIKDEEDLIASLSNVSALIMDTIPNLNWVGFYRLIDDELVLGPFQGHVACFRIKVGQGVCGTAVKERKTIVVDDVHAFKGHIACDNASNSEVVIPLFRNDGNIYGVLDIDSPLFNRFDQELVSILENVAKKIEEKL